MVGIATPSGAYIASVSGQIAKISPPADVRTAGICSPNQALAFDEQQGVTLGAAMKADFKNPGSYAELPSTPITIAAGSVVDSHFLDSNLNGCLGTPNRSGTWTFAQDILGVIVSRNRLDSSDVLGAPGTNYGGAYPSRELEFGSGTSADSIQIVDARTVTVNLQTLSSTDQVRVVTKHNSPPAPNAGGPYAGLEGSPVSLSGSAPDPDGDPVTKSWSFAVAASPGTACTTTGTTTFTPSITCNDDALVTATLSASDGYHAAVTSAATVNITNRAPAITSVTVPAAPVALGAPVNLSAVFSDAGAHDTHTATIAWGDGPVPAASVNEGTHTVTGSHTYSLPGLYSITLTVNDDDGGTVSVTTADVLIVGPPTASAGGPYNSDEGSGIGLVGSASGALPLTKSWVFTPGPSDPGTACSYTGVTTLTPTVNCNDDIVVGAQLTVTDGVNAPVVSSSSVAVTNVAPVLNPLTATAGPIIVGQTVTVGGAFTDVGTNDTHVSSVDWGDMTSSPATVTEVSGSGSVSATHAYLTPGLKSISVDVNDNDGGIATRTITVLVNAPPVANAGGPYVGDEGSTLTLGGTASDSNGDPLTISWSFAVAGGPGTACTYSGTATLIPTVNCNDNATVTATLTVSDGINAPVSSVATVIVGNVSPTAGAVSTTASPVGVGASVSASVSFADVGTNDTHTGVIDWGDGVTSATIVESGGSGTASGTHAYATAGSYTISITITDDDTGTVTATAATPVVVNSPPTANAAGPYSGAEGSLITLAASATDPDGDPLTKSWTFAVAGTPGTTCASTDTTTLSPTLQCNDNAIVTATLTVSDGINAPVSSVAVVTVTNVAPSAHPVIASPTPVAAGATLSVASGFADDGTHDTHFAFIFWGDGNIGVASITESGGTGTASGTHAYSLPGPYTVTMTIVDDDTGSVTVTTPTPVVVT
jgi:PKD domain.